jgi:hypothetical protein
MRGLRIEYRLPSRTVDRTPCPLKLRFDWVDGRTENQVCLEKPAGTVFLPMADLVGDSPTPRNFGALRSIDWVLAPFSDAKTAGVESFDLRFAIDGGSIVSPAEEMRAAPVFIAGGQAFFAAPRTADELVAGNFPVEAWIPLEEGALDRVLAARAHIQPTGRWPYTVDQVVAEPSQPVTAERVKRYRPHDCA